jgi:hypothetical protein
MDLGIAMITLFIGIAVISFAVLALEDRKGENVNVSKARIA